MDKQQEALIAMFDEALTVFNGRDYSSDIRKFVEVIASKSNILIPNYTFNDHLNAVMLGCFTMGVQFPYLISIEAIIRTLEGNKGSGAMALPADSLKLIGYITKEIETRADNLFIPKMIEDGYIKLIEADEGPSTVLFDSLLENAHNMRHDLSNEHRSVSVGYLASPLAMRILDKHRMQTDYFIQSKLEPTGFNTMYGLPFFVKDQIPNGKIGIVAICSGYETVSAQDKYPEWVDIILKHGNTI